MARHVDLVGAISCFRFYAGYADKIHGQTMELGRDMHGYTKREPYGVCGQIIPVSRNHHKSMALPQNR